MIGAVSEPAGPNYFAPAWVAGLYARGRPYFHPLVAERIAAAVGATGRLGLAVDVGCGTGLSTLALAPLADRVLGLDPAASMVAQAPAGPGLAYAIAAGEALPLAPASCDLLTVSSALHWLAPSRFFAEARRALRPGGHVAVYDNYFRGQMAEDGAFERWLRERHLPRYPTPPRPRPSFRSDALPSGFRLALDEPYQNEQHWALGQLVDYLLTQTNVISAVEGGRESADVARAWLEDELGPIMAGRERGTFLFGGPLWVLRLA